MTEVADAQLMVDSWRPIAVGYLTVSDDIAQDTADTYINDPPDTQAPRERLSYSPRM